MGEDRFFTTLGGKVVFEFTPKQYREMSEMFSPPNSNHNVTCKACWAQVRSSDRMKHHSWHHEEEQRMATLAIELVRMLAELPDLRESGDGG